MLNYSAGHILLRAQTTGSVFMLNYSVGHILLRAQTTGSDFMKNYHIYFHVIYYLHQTYTCLQNYKYSNYSNRYSYNRMQ